MKNVPMGVDFGDFVAKINTKTGNHSGFSAPKPLSSQSRYHRTKVLGKDMLAEQRAARKSSAAKEQEIKAEIVREGTVVNSDEEAKADKATD